MLNPSEPDLNAVIIFLKYRSQMIAEWAVILN